jgi:hypothetical protein
MYTAVKTPSTWPAVTKILELDDNVASVVGVGQYAVVVGTVSRLFAAAVWAYTPLAVAVMAPANV